MHKQWQWQWQYHHLLPQPLFVTHGPFLGLAPTNLTPPSTTLGTKKSSL